MFRTILIAQHFSSHWQRHPRLYTRYLSLVSWKIQCDWNPKQFLPVWMYCSALHGTTLTADSGGVCTVWIESTVTSTLPLLSAGASENRGGNCTGRCRLGTGCRGVFCSANSGPTPSEKVCQMAQQADTEYFPRGLPHTDPLKTLPPHITTLKTLPPHTSPLKTSPPNTAAFKTLPPNTAALKLAIQYNHFSPLPLPCHSSPNLYNE